MFKLGFCGELGFLVSLPLKGKGDREAVDE